MNKKIVDLYCYYSPLILANMFFYGQGRECDVSKSHKWGKGVIIITANWQKHFISPKYYTSIATPKHLTQQKQTDQSLKKHRFYKN